MKQAAIAAVVLALPTAVAAQDFMQMLSPLPPPIGYELPKTNVIKTPDGTVIGTATGSGNVVVYRNAKGELTGSSRVTADNEITYYDPHGTIVKIATISDGKLIMRNAAGEIVETKELQRK